MIDLLSFLLLTAVISFVHVTVTQTSRHKTQLREVTAYFLSASGGMLLLAALIEALSLLFQY